MTNSQNRIYYFRNYFALMLISPVIAMAVAIQHASPKLLTRVTRLFFVFFGALFFAGTDGADATRHLQSVRDNYFGMSFGTFLSDFLDLLFLNPKPYANDAYKHVLSFIAGIFYYPELIHVLAGMVLGFFFSQSMYLLYKSKGSFNVSKYILFFLIIFVSNRTLIGLNSIRMWTGMWVLFYFSLCYWNKKSIPNLLALTIIPIFFHFSYVIFVLPVLIAFFLRKYRVFVIVLYVISFSFSLNLTAIQSYLPKDDELFQKKATYMQSEETIEQKATRRKENSKNVATFVNIGTTVYKAYSIPFLCVLIIYFLLLYKNDDLLNYLIICGLLMLTFSNFVGFSPSISGRSFTIAATYLVASSLLIMRSIYNENSTLAQSWRIGSVVFFIVSAPFLFFNVVVILRMVSAFILIFPAISLFLGNDDISVRDFFVQLF